MRLLLFTTFPINIKNGWIQVTLSPEKRFDNPGAFQEIINPEELLSCWNTVKHIVDNVVRDQIDRASNVVQQSAKTRMIVDIYNSLSVKKTVDDSILLEEVLKTGKFSDEEAKLLIKQVKEEKVDNGVAWY